MKNIVKSLLAVVVLSTSATASAQNLETGYFNDNYLYRHEMNPALDNEKGYVAMPFVLGNMNVGVSGNLNMKNYLFNIGGKTATFMHPDVNTNEFLCKVKESNELHESFKYQLIGVGFKGIGGYNTIGLSVKQNLDVALPGDLFRLAKNGVSTRTYDLTNLSAHADAYVELALGHSHKINDNLKVGGKVKFLFGAGNVDLVTNNAQVTLGSTRSNVAATASMDAEIHGNVKGIQYSHDKDGKIDGIDEIKSPGLGGFGVAFDLGAEYRLNEHWKFSAAFLDLGFISWFEDHAGSIKQTNFELSPMYNVDDDEFQDADGQKIDDKLKELYNLQDMGDMGSRTTALGATMNIGAEYTTHFYDRLKIGALNTTRIQGKYSWTDFRFSANVRPVDWFSATANLSVGTYGVGFGWMLDFQAKKGFDFFIAMDHTPGKFSKQFVPLNSNAEFSMGINFPF